MEAIRLVRLDSPLPRRRREIRVAAAFDFGRLVQPLAYLVAIAIAAAGGLLLLRRFMGVLSTPLGSAGLLATAFISICSTALAHLMFHYARRSPPRSWQEKTIDWLPTIGLTMIATALSLPGSSVAAIVLVWALIACEEYATSFVERNVRKARPPERSLPHRLVRMRPGGVRWQRNGPFTDGPPVESEDWLSADSIQQRYVRERTAESETIRGTLRVAVEKGQRLAVAHLVFCPALADVPAIEAELTGDIEGSIRATHVFRYGARLEIRLSEPCDAPADVLVDYHVQTPAPGA